MNPHICGTHTPSRAPYRRHFPSYLLMSATGQKGTIIIGANGQMAEGRLLRLPTALHRTRSNRRPKKNASTLEHAPANPRPTFAYETLSLAFGWLVRDGRHRVWLWLDYSARRGFLARA